MKRTLFAVIVLMFSHRVFAVGGVGDIVYDPTAQTQMTTMIEQAKEMYKSAKEQLDKMVSMERTIREAQQAYDTLSKYDLQRAIKGITDTSKNSTASFAALRAEIANKESGVSNNVGFVQGNLARIQNLENLELLKSAMTSNINEANGSPNQSTTSKMTAQSTSALAALAASEEQRKLTDEHNREMASEAEARNFKNTKKVYEAMGK